MALDTHGLSPKRTILGLATLLGGAALTAGAVIGTAAGVGAVWHATNPPAAAGSPGAHAAAAASPAPSGAKITIENVKTPEGAQPAFVGPNGPGAKVLVSLKAGVATTLTIVNHSDQPHTFSSSALGVNVMVPPGPASVQVHLDPKKPGTIPWDCTVPCGAWVMSHAGYMQGSLKVLA